MARIGYALLLGGVAWGIHRWRSRRLLARNEALKLQVALATSELLQSKQALEVLNQDLEKLNARKNEFMGIAAHDLRNPLTGLLLESELLREETDFERIQVGMDRIQAQGRVMEGLVSRLLNANAIEEGAFHMDMRVFDLSPVVWEALVQFEERAQKKNIQIAQDIPLDPMIVQADPLLVRQVLDNLVSNALKFSLRGTRVEVRLEALARGVRISVQDQGPGLTREDRVHLFGRYRRLSAQPSEGEASVGLGLFIVKQMVDAMQGTIDVESEPGHGACFRVTLEGPPNGA
jgi:signal transduction histidine kinase